MGLLPIEKETIVTTSDEDKSKWHIYTRQKKIINKLLKQDREPIRIIKDENGDIYSAEFEIGFKELNFKGKKKDYTPEEIAMLQERARKARESINK